MKRIRTRSIRGLIIAGSAVCLVSGVVAQGPQVQNGLRNSFSEAGVPEDPEPPGPTARTGNQFESGTAYGGWRAGRITDSAGVVVAGSANAAGDPGVILNPRDDTGKIQLGSAKFARPMVVRAVSFALGSDIPRPTEKPSGEKLDPDIFAEAEFYFREPANADAGRFYWSPHAQRLFANQPGVVTVDWRERVSGNIVTKTYTVSGSPVKPTKTIYWTATQSGKFNGPTVGIPDTKVERVNIIYSETFPEIVSATEAYDYDPNDPDDPGLLRDTLWHDETTDVLHAYNVEGRLLVEFLGGEKEDDASAREHLGFEIVDVVREPRKEELEISIGERVLPVAEAEMTPEHETLVPEPVAGDQDFLHTHTNGDLYAIRETSVVQPSNEVLIYWKEEGVLRLRWPKTYVRYAFIWPEDREHYSIYARPEDSTLYEATGVPLAVTGNPEIVYQDHLGNQHAKLTAGKVFYTDPDQGSRALIRYTNESGIWFERVYSIPNHEFEDVESVALATIGTRIDPPTHAEALVGYVNEEIGTAFNENAYIDPFAEGFERAADGAIIPVNTHSPNLGDQDTGQLEVWWFQASAVLESAPFTATRWPSFVKRYRPAWPVTDEDDANLYDEIVMARNDGSGELGIAATGTIYRQPDKTKDGYNPNEEHAIMSGGVAWALRDDLNTEDSSEPYVLIDYTAEDGRPAMAIRRVVRENAMHTFHYDASVGVILQAPMPLPVMELPIDANGDVKNVEVAEAGSHVADLTNVEVKDLERYDRFTHVDRKGFTWIYRGPHADDDAATSFTMCYYYKTRPSFDFPDGGAPSDGIANYLSPVDGPKDKPLEIRFMPHWPSNPPVLGVAETLALPKRGLPAIRGQLSAKILYQQSLAVDRQAGVSELTKSAKLIDPTRAKVYPLSSTGLDEIPESIATSVYQGKTYFPNLPPHLSQRLYVDPNIGSDGALVFVGEFVDAAFGEDYFHLNVMSDEDLIAAKGLVDPSDRREGEWIKAIDGLTTTLETFIEDPGRRGTYKIDPALDQNVPVEEVAEVIYDDTAVDSYAISAVGGGTGYVVVATGDGEAFTPKDEPVSMHVFKVAPPLYRGELKVVASANPLDEKLTLRHSADFAGNPSDYQFSWLTAPPVGGFPPTLYSFAGITVFAKEPGAGWRIFQNPEPGYETARDLDHVEDPSAWSTVDALLTINDGHGEEANGTTLPNALLRDTFEWSGDAPIDLYLSLKIGDNDGAAVYLNGAEIAVWNVPERTNTVTTTAPGTISGQALPRVFAVPPTTLQSENTITVDLYTVSDPGARSLFDLRLNSQQETEVTSGWNPIQEAANSSYTIGGASIFTLTDNYFTMRYRAKEGTDAALATGGSNEEPGAWSRWMSPQLAEGWIKRALAGINPFNQRVTNLFSNTVNTDVSLVSQAGKRWEGDIALNLENIDDFGLIEIYETILRRGKDLSIGGAPPLNVPAANDALLLAAGYLNDLYMLLGHEAYADAANPTIAYSTDSGLFGTSAQFGELNTALYAFKGQLANVLEEELALLRGRDDSLQPGVTVSPVYNRLVWNFTNGINSGEPIYALNYNIEDFNADGAADATDAAEQYPQGHGDAYGHYLTALKGYYTLLNHANFGWTPRIEAVSVLGQPVSIDYQDERKFAAAAAATAGAASQTLDLTYRQQYSASEGAGWESLSDAKVNTSTGTTRHWGTDDWAVRAGQGALFHWVTANSLLPEEDNERTGIEKVDRTTVPELDELASVAGSIQSTLDKADSRLNPLGLAAGALSFDISPSEIDAGKTHYEQIYDRAVVALRNADFAFDNAKDSTQLLRRQEDSLAERRHAIAVAESTYERQLVELYGTPYTDDIGPGKTYAQGYDGPDVLHYAYIDLPENSIEETPVTLSLSEDVLRKIDPDGNALSSASAGEVIYTMNEDGVVAKPNAWTGRRKQPGLLQSSFSAVRAAQTRLLLAVDAYETKRADFISLAKVVITAIDARADESRERISNEEALEKVKDRLVSAAVGAAVEKAIADRIFDLGLASAEALPQSAGTSNDATSGARSTTLAIAVNASFPFDIGSAVLEGKVEGNDSQVHILEAQLENLVAGFQWQREHEQLLHQLRLDLHQFGGLRLAVSAAIRELDQAKRDFRSLIAKGDRIQAERETFRKRAAAIVQGYRTNDLAFRVFRDEALEKYKTLFDLAARYTYLAARAYDFETGLLDADRNSAVAGFFKSIVGSRALGVLDANGVPQFSASTIGDPGLAGVLAQMQGDWSVAKSRLGFNNPDLYRTTFSLRRENFRIIDGEEGDVVWRDRLAAARMNDVLADPDVRRYAMQIDKGNGQPVPGFVLNFQTTIADGKNFFGRPLTSGDHSFSPSSFATKIRTSGIAFEGYVGLDSPTTSGGSLGGIGAVTQNDPPLGFLDPNGLSATPYIYLIPTGVDSMRSPPLGDTSTVRQWTVSDQSIPLPFNIGNSNYATDSSFISADSLNEDPFQIRKHQAFRAIPSGAVFSSAPGFTNARLVGRSVWNSQWKIVIPGRTLRHDAQSGLEAFQDTVTDILLFFETYSYAGN